jgi:sulfur-oxidizing protein SoxA
VKGIAPLLAIGFVCGAHAAAPADARKSGYDFMGRATQAMQDDDVVNPAMLWVQEGERLFNTAPEPKGKACAACHSATKRPLEGVAATHPRFDAARQRPITLSQRIEQCRREHQRQTATQPESREQLALLSFVAFQSRGKPIAPYRDPRMTPFFLRGKQLFHTRMGQLDLSCADCHDKHAGKRLAGNPIPQAHPTAYPLYRLEWQEVGSLQRRIRNCMSGIRAEPFPFDAPEMAELETYLASRAAGMTIESPGVRP